MRIRAFSVIRVAFLFLYSLGCAAVTQAREKNHVPTQRPVLEVFKDETHSFSITQVTTPEFRSRFRHIPDDDYNYGLSEASYWFRLELEPSELARILQIESPSLDKVAFYFPNDTIRRSFSIQKSGTSVPFDSRAIPHSYPLFKIPATQSLQVCYIHVQTTGPLLMPVTLMTEEAFRQQDHTRQFWEGLFYGIMLVMTAYNFILYLSLRDRSYLFYVLYLLAAILFQLSMSGYGAEFLWDTPTWWSVRAITISSTLTAMLIVVFCLEFLQVKKRLPFWYKVGLGFVASCLLNLLVIVIQNNSAVSFLLSIANAVLFLVVIMGITIRAILAHNRSAIYLLVAWLILKTSIITGILSGLGLLLSHVPVLLFMQIGLCADVILLSLALADRINTIRIQNVQVEQQKLTAERNHQIKEEVLATMSHEIRTPLNAVTGFAKLLEKTTLNKTQSGYVRHIRESADNLLMLINDILDLSKINAGKVTFEQIEIDLQHVTDVLFQTIRFQVSSKQLDLKLDIAPEVPLRFLGDPIRLNQILLNLLSNAVKFTHEGSVTLRIRPYQSDKQTITLLFEVEDTGIGIATSKLPSIFEGFTQATYDTTRIYGGTGLGLAITKQLVEMQGGSISVHSKVNSGSTFTLLLPFYKAYDTPEAVDTTEGFADKKDTILPLHLLLIEDNPLNQVIARTTIESASASLPAYVDVASTGTEGIEMFQVGQYHVVLIDLQLPDMDGPEVAQRIRKQYPEKKNVPLIALTASLDEREHQQALQAGMNDVVTKPFEADKLFEKIIKLRPDLHNSTEL